MMVNIQNVANSWKPERGRPQREVSVAGMPCSMMGSRPLLTKRGMRMTTVTHEIDGKVGVVTLTKPPHNLLDDTERLAQRAGIARAKEIAMLGRRHTPQAFERWGIINQVVPESELGSASMTWARQLAAGPTQVIKGIKLQANLEARGGIAAADARQVDINHMIWKGKDRQRGLDAFLTSGPPTAAFHAD